MTPVLRASVALHAGAALAALAVPGAGVPALAAIAANQALLVGAGMAPRSRLLGPNLRRLPAATGTVALTFDDGPDPEVTPAVLDRLAEAGARATFFVIGRRARAHPGLVRAIAAAGHAVQNHTDTHPYRFAALPPPALRREVRGASDTIAGLTGIPPRLFRAPMGFRSPLLEPLLRRERLHLVSWTRRALDGVSGDAAAARRRLLAGLAPGDILLMHDGSAARTRHGRPVVLEILPALLDAIGRQGLRTVALDERVATRLDPAPGSG
jgi:peptidoglycan-N-acetylglucosamine deacetylase